MRWHKVIEFEHLEHRVGDIRILRRFLFLPLRIGDETRWLEIADIVQELVTAGNPLDPPHYRWKTREWGVRLNKKEQWL